MSGMRKETEEKYKEICRLFWSEKSLDEIAEEVHCSRATVDRAISIYGAIPKRDSFDNHKEEAIALWEQGATGEQIAERTGLSISTVNRNLRDMGYRRRRKRAESRKTAEPPYQEEELELFPLAYAKTVRRAERIVIRGKVYLDVSA